GGLAMAALVTVAAGRGYWGLQTTIGERRTFWEGVLGAHTETGIEVLAMPSPAMPANLVEDEPVRTLHTRNVSLATTPLNVPKVFEPWEWVGADITASSKVAHGQVFARGVLAPLVEEAARKLAAE